MEFLGELIARTDPFTFMLMVVFVYGLVVLLLVYAILLVNTIMWNRAYKKQRNRLLKKK